MEEGLVGFMFGCLVSALVGLACYDAAERTMKQRAIDADVACYVTAKESGKTDFKFNCDKENK